jgi:hypothetical protein
MPLLQLTRSNEYVNSLRSIKIFLDGKLLGTIKNAETKDFEIPEGNHLLQAKIDWCSSNTISFTIVPGETKAFSMNSFAQNNRLGIFATIYYISLGTNKFLHLKQIA